MIVDYSLLTIPSLFTQERTPVIYRTTRLALYRRQSLSLTTLLTVLLLDSNLVLTRAHFLNSIGELCPSLLGSSQGSNLFGVRG